MKKNIYLLCLLLAASILFVSCRKDEDDVPYISTSIDGVVINGVRWATRNVDTPGTFAASPESSGMFFQWNRRKGWPAIGDVMDWENEQNTDIYWTRVNDPCPVGWRVPTIQEFMLLSEATTGLIFDSGEWHYYLIRHRARHWVENWRNTGVNGWILGAEPNFIFLPAAGERNWRGVFELAGVIAYYWSSTADTRDLGTDGWLWFEFFTGLGTASGSEASPGRPIRCVADE